MFPTVIISPKSIQNSQSSQPIKSSKTTNLNSKLILNPLTLIRNLKNSKPKDSSNKHRLPSNNWKKTPIKWLRNKENIKKLEKIFKRKKIKSFQPFWSIFNKLDKKKFKDIERKSQRETGNVEYFIQREKNLHVEDKEFKVDFKGNYINRKWHLMKIWI